jgi:hypothetical protein
MGEDKDFVVTPWKVEGKIDYDRLIEEFGTERITQELRDRIYKVTKEKHFMLERELFFSHRDLNWIFDEYEKGNKFTYSQSGFKRSLILDSTSSLRMMRSSSLNLS